jgi:hypothetical protein
MYQSPVQAAPSQAVSREKLNPFETMFHLTATVFTFGLWGVVWWARCHSRKTVTHYL